MSGMIAFLRALIPEKCGRLAGCALLTKFRSDLGAAEQECGSTRHKVGF